MKERPILFSGAMVCAMLAGRKTQTRRIVAHPHADEVQVWARVPANGACWDMGVFVEGSSASMGFIRCPYGAPGDRLWVRETWRAWEESCVTSDRHEDDEVCGDHCEQTYVAYAATPREGYRPDPDKARITYLDSSTPIESDPRLLGPWRPSIHMPRWASRITLEVTEVRVERLQAITEEDAEAEGVVHMWESGWHRSDCHPWSASYSDEGVCLEPAGCTCPNYGAIADYAELWDHINAKRAPWNSNPWVWAISFERAQS